MAPRNGLGRTANTTCCATELTIAHILCYSDSSKGGSRQANRRVDGAQYDISYTQLLHRRCLISSAHGARRARRARSEESEIGGLARRRESGWGRVTFRAAAVHASPHRAASPAAGPGRRPRPRLLIVFVHADRPAASHCILTVIGLVPPLREAVDILAALKETAPEPGPSRPGDLR